MSRVLSRLVLALLLAASTAASADDAVLETPAGSLTLTLTDAAGQQLISEHDQAIGAALHWDGSVPVRVTLSLLAEAVEGLPAGSRLWRDRFLFITGETWRASISARGAGFEIGRYVLEAETEAGAVLRVPLEVAPDHPPAELVTRLPGGTDVALAILGASAASPVPAESSRWAPENLIDGFARIRDEHGGLVSAGWRTLEPLPAEVVIDLAGDRPATIDTLVFDTVVEDGFIPLRGGFLQRSIVPRSVEVAVSEEEEPTAFRAVAVVRLWNRAAKQSIALEPVAARHVRLRLLEGYGDGRGAALGEVRIYESQGEPSVLDEMDPDIALPALGGSVAAVTSEAPDNRAIELIDGIVGPERGWSSAKSAGGALLPQDVVLAFRDGAPAAIDRVEITPESSPRYAVGVFDQNWPALVSLGVAMDSPHGPFEEIARITLPAEPGPVVVPVSRTVRFLRIRVLENHGGDRVTMGEVAVYEATSGTGGSIVASPSERGWRTEAGPFAEATLPEGSSETEPNDDAARDALALDGTPVRGILEPADDIDRWRLELEADQPRTVTLHLQTTGLLRTALRLRDAEGKLVKSFVPTGMTTQAVVTWRLAPGHYELELFEPERVTALVWDTSGSMAGRSEALEEAVRGYIAAMGMHESILPVRFGGEAKLLLEEPSADRTVLDGAIEGQFEPEGGTMLYDAVAEARAALDRVDGTAAIIVLTDGQDTGSRTMLSALRHDLARDDVHLLAIGLGDNLDELGLAAGGTGHDVLRSLAQAAGGRYFVQPDAAELPALYAALAAELGGVQRYALAVTAAEREGRLEVTQTGEPIPSLAAPPRVVLVLDASGSMKRGIGGRPMIEIAREVLVDVVRGLPESVEAALWTFGHRVREGQAGDCQDIEEMVPLGPLDRDALAQRIGTVGALGTTPIAETLERVGTSLRGAEGEHMVVLVTDGEEECRDDLVKVAAALREGGLDLDLHIVGFAMDDEAVRAGLARAAEAAGGSFLHAGEAASLAVAMEQALVASFTVLDGAGDAVARERVGATPLALAVGQYDVVVETTGEPLVIEDVAITAGMTTRITLDKQGNDIGVTTTPQP